MSNGYFDFFLAFLDKTYLIIAEVIFAFCIAYYFILVLQWYNYSLRRSITKHHKVRWHFVYFLFPIIIYSIIPIDKYLFAFSILYIGLFVVFVKGLNDRLKFTSRVIRFFIAYAILLAISEYTRFVSGQIIRVKYLFPLLEIILAFIICQSIERALLKKYTKKAKEKLKAFSDLKIIGITGSYGKTSIKNFLYTILNDTYSVYKTPGNVNTFVGIVQDINNNLQTDRYNMYIAEMGARQKGDIKQIAELLEYEYAILGTVGSQHLEYFKSLENIVQTKLEILQSPNLKHTFINSQNDFGNKLKDIKYISCPAKNGIRNIKSSLDGLSFKLLLGNEYYLFEAQILGAFNITNIALAIYCAFSLGVKIETIQKKVSKIKPIPHRLQKIGSGDKLIIDDSYNGNLEGMQEAIQLCSQYKGRKVVVTPGIAESNESQNKILAKDIDNVFDIVIITGELNSHIFRANIKKAQKIIMQNKKNMQNLLKSTLKDNDLVIFLNDTPDYM